jgi:hypothetical protein
MYLHRSSSLPLIPSSTPLNLPSPCRPSSIASKFNCRFDNRDRSYVIQIDLPFRADWQRRYDVHHLTIVLHALAVCSCHWYNFECPVRLRTKDYVLVQHRRSPTGVDGSSRIGPECTTTSRGSDLRKTKLMMQVQTLGDRATLSLF